MKKTIKNKKRHYSANTLEFGLWGTVIGFIVAAVGMLLIKTENKHKQAAIPTESG